MSMLLFFLLGAALGSFTLVFVERVMDGSGVGGRSRCDFCKTVLRMRDMIPVLSFLFLGGVCRHCRNHISPWHFFVEIALGGLFLGALFVAPEIGPTHVFMRMFVLSALFCLFVFDTRYGVLPDLITFPAILFVFIYQWLSGGTVIDMLGGALIGFGVFGSQYALSRGRWVGSGDMRLGALMGVLLGVNGVLLALFLAYIFGGMIAAVLMIMRKKRRGDTLPMGAFLIPATVVVWYYGNTILSWLM